MSRKLPNSLIRELARLKIRLVGLDDRVVTRCQHRFPGVCVNVPASREPWHSIPKCCFSTSPRPASIP